MYPFQVILVGCEKPLAEKLRPVLDGMGVRVEGEFPGLETAVEALRARAAGQRDPRQVWAESNNAGIRPTAPEPTRLFVFRLEKPPNLEHLRRLTVAFSGQPVIALLDAGGDPSLPVAAMRAGAGQVVLLPLQPDDLRAAINCLALQYGGGGSGQVIAIAGVTGGAGATTVAANLAFELAHHYKIRVVLAELSLQVGKLPAYLDVRPKTTVNHLLREPGKIDAFRVQDALIPAGDRVALLAGPVEPGPPINPDAADVNVLADALRQLADVVLLDVPCTYDTFYFDVLGLADKVVLVAEQKVPSIRALQMINTNLGHKKAIMLLNRYDPNVKGFGAARLMELLQAPTLLTVANDYEAVTAAVGKGRPLRLEAPRSKVLADLAQLARALVPSEQELAPQTAGVTSVFSGLMRAFGLK